LACIVVKDRQDTKRGRWPVERRNVTIAVQWKWSIKFDDDLGALLDAQGIEDPGEEMVVCGALCALGLAEHKMFTDDTLESQVSMSTLFELLVCTFFDVSLMRGGAAPRRG
jgi:hypothetical protein